MKKEENKLVDNEILDLEEFNSIDIEGKNSYKENKDKTEVKKFVKNINKNKGWQSFL